MDQIQKGINKIELKLKYIQSTMLENKKVYIASMNLRGKWAECSESGIKLNVTSAQRKESVDRKVFSPMTEIVGGYNDYYCFENYWQAGKVIEGVDQKQKTNYWKNLKECKRRYPKSKDKKIVGAVYPDVNPGKLYNYIESRKEVYVPQYYALIKDSERLEYYKRQLKEKNIIVYDFDGPRDINGEPVCLEVNLELLKNKINDTRHPFGHGYVVAASLLNIEPEEYT